MLTVSNAGFQIAYEVIGRGSGPGFLFAQSKVGWVRMGYVEALKAHGRVLIVDPRGFGESSRARDAAHYSLEGFCDDLLAAADAVGLEQFVAWGYSNTAALAVALASKSDRAVGLVCAGMDPFLDFTGFTAHLDNEVREVGARRARWLSSRACGPIAPTRARLRCRSRRRLLWARPSEASCTHGVLSLRRDRPEGVADSDGQELFCDEASVPW